MRAHTASFTAQMVAFGRAAAHGRLPVSGFSDPIAARLLTPAQRARLEQLDSPPSGLRARVRRRFLDQLSGNMALRTVAIDDALRQGLPIDQVVILGAGLDARAWRMAELGGCTVYEVDHPATQAFKRERIGALAPAAREIRFVAVDFERDSLTERLAEAGHDATRPTIWVWEGVVMYLRPGDVEATLRGVAARSTIGSRIIVQYAMPSRARHPFGLFLRLKGEPFRSAFTPGEMAALLQRTGFSVLSDERPDDWNRRYAGGALHLRTQARMRIAIASRVEP